MGCRGLDFGGDRGTGGRVGWECFGSRVVHFQQARRWRSMAESTLGDLYLQKKAQQGWLWQVGENNFHKQATFKRAKGRAINLMVDVANIYNNLTQMKEQNETDLAIGNLLHTISQYASTPNKHQITAIDCILVYGHNRKSDPCFKQVVEYQAEEKEYLRRLYLVHQFFPKIDALSDYYKLHHHCPTHLHFSIFSVVSKNIRLHNRLQYRLNCGGSPSLETEEEQFDKKDEYSDKLRGLDSKRSSAILADICDRIAAATINVKPKHYYKGVLSTHELSFHKFLRSQQKKQIINKPKHQSHNLRRRNGFSNGGKDNQQNHLPPINFTKKRQKSAIKLIRPKSKGMSWKNLAPSQTLTGTHSHTRQQSEIGQYHKKCHFQIKRPNTANGYSRQKYRNSSHKLLVKDSIKNTKQKSMPRIVHQGRILKRKQSNQNQLSHNADFPTKTKNRANSNTKLHPSNQGRNSVGKFRPFVSRKNVSNQSQNLQKIYQQKAHGLCTVESLIKHKLRIRG